MKKIFFIFFTLILFLTCEFLEQPLANTKGGAAMELKSTAFKEGELIPVKYTCDGVDISPPLEWGSVPAETKSLALISDDPDAPVGTWVHWVYYNIPADTKSLPEKILPQAKPDTGGVQGVNDFRKIGYGGPCPPGGTHRYYFKLYALDANLDLSSGASKKDLLNAMEGHVISQAQLMGKYKR